MKIFIAGFLVAVTMIALSFAKNKKENLATNKAPDMLKNINTRSLSSQDEVE